MSSSTSQALKRICVTLGGSRCLPSGRPTYVAKLAGSLLGVLRYERGQLDEAEELL
jgi:hypothetical protein